MLYNKIIRTAETYPYHSNLEIRRLYKYILYYFSVNAIYNLINDYDNARLYIHVYDYMYIIYIIYLYISYVHRPCPNFNASAVIEYITL